MERSQNLGPSINSSSSLVTRLVWTGTWFKSVRELEFDNEYQVEKSVASLAIHLVSASYSGNWVIQGLGLNLVIVSVPLFCQRPSAGP